MRFCGLELETSGLESYCGKNNFPFDITPFFYFGMFLEKMYFSIGKNQFSASRNFFHVHSQLWISENFHFCRDCIIITKIYIYFSEIDWNSHYQKNYYFRLIFFVLCYQVSFFALNLTVNFTVLFSENLWQLENRKFSCITCQIILLLIYESFFSYQNQ